MSLKNVNEVLASVILSQLEEAGLSRLGMVLALASHLGVADQIVPRQEADELRAQLRRATEQLSEARARSGEGETQIGDGDLVATPRGPARALILTQDEFSVLERVLAAASAS
jgi:hypothetical protein